MIPKIPFFCGSLHILILLFLSVICLASDYHESLLLKPLPQNALLASFNFRSNSTLKSFEKQHFRYFPRSLGQILEHAHTKELHLRFSLGRWDAQNWGARPWDGAREGGTGVELWAWLEGRTDEEVFSRWLTLTNTLSGLFCASLNFIDSTRTIRPEKTFEPEGIHPKGSLEGLQLLHGTLPHEVVCTENLTPFLKLLPCKGKAGISSLLDGHKLFDSSWQTMAIDVRPICDGDDSNCVLQIEQTVDMVLDLDRSKRPRDNPIPRPVPIDQIECDTSKPYHAEDSCYPLEKGTDSSWSVEEVFGRSIKGSCSLSSDASSPFPDSVCVDLTAQNEGVVIETTPQIRSSSTTDGLTCYSVPSGIDLNLQVPVRSRVESASLLSPRLHAFRSITGYGQERGGVHAVLTNNDPVSAVELIYLESLPWYMKPYLHTLRATMTPPAGNASMTSLEAPSSPIRETFYRPSFDRQRGTQIELRLVVPPGGTLTLTYDFEKALLRYTEYPPDANRGFDVAPAVVRILPSSFVSGLSDGSSGMTTRDRSATDLRKGAYVRTTSLLLPLPTPDFSMPYNVIILTSTVISLGFGSIFNILVRRFVAAEETGQGGVVGKIKDAFRRLKERRGQGKQTKVE